jgi:NADH:ubiquinone oxidoreductase subunit K
MPSRRGRRVVVYGILALEVLLNAGMVELVVDDDDWPEPLRWIPTEPILAFLIVSVAEWILIAAVAMAARARRRR